MYVPDAAAMEELGARIAQAGQRAGVIYLKGELGAGKTTFVRGLAHALGVAGTIKSPTYTLVEPYAVGATRVYHFDLYRLSDAEELEYLGVRDYFDEDALCLIEWPERGLGFLPRADLTVEIHREGEGRRVELKATGSIGERLLAGAKS